MCAAVLCGPMSASGTVVSECLHPLFPMVGEPKRLPLPIDSSSVTAANKRNIEQTYCTGAPDKWLFTYILILAVLDSFITVTLNWVTMFQMLQAHQRVVEVGAFGC